MKSRSRRKLQLIIFVALAFAYVVFWIFSGNISDNRSLFNIQRVRTGTVYEQHLDETLVEMRWSCFDQVTDYDKTFGRYEDDYRGWNYIVSLSGGRRMIGMGRTLILSGDNHHSVLSLK